LNSGYITSLRQHETEALCVETHKVIRLDNVLDIIRGIERIRGDVTQAVTAQLKDSIVLTGYKTRPTVH